MGNSVLLKADNGIATLFLNEPKSLNALSMSLKLDLLDALNKIKEDSDIRFVIITGNGKAFCAGGDIHAMAEKVDPLEIKRNMEISVRIIDTLRKLPKIVLAAVHGYAAGAGFSISLASDLIVAEEGTRFVLSFKNVGLNPDLGLLYHLPKIVGEWKAKEWIWNGAKITAEEAKDFGFVKEVVPKGQVYERAHEIAKELISGPMQSYIHSKLIINSSSYLSLEDVLQMESEAHSLLRETYDHREGVQAFFEKRLPKFMGK